MSSFIVFNISAAKIQFLYSQPIGFKIFFHLVIFLFLRQYNFTKNKNHQDQSNMLRDKVFKRMNSTNLNSPFIKYGCEIVKYQPQYYKDRVYTKNEWISVSDIGRNFDGEMLTKEEYLRVESAYVDTVKELLEVSGVKFLTIVEPNTFYWRRSKAFNKENKAIYQIVSSLKEGQRIAASKIDTVLKACLRELFWCALVNEAKKVQVDVGYDYYLHFHSRLPEETISKIARSHGLYCNPR